MRIVCLGLIAIAAAAQPRVSRPATVEGQVVNDSDDKPLRRAHVTLRPMEAGLNAIGVDADEKGSFIIRDIPPGRYILTAERDGYLASSTVLRGPLRMPQVFAIRSNDRVSSLAFRLRPAALIAGRVRFEDAEPAVNVRIDAYREYRVKGRAGYNVVASARTDDRGEYRMYGLRPGSYVVAAAHESAAPQKGYIDQIRTDDEGHEVPVFAYTTTFYPNTVKLSEAVPIQLDYGKEVPGIDLFLRPVRKVKIHGRVRSGSSGRVLASATLTLQRIDAHNVAAIAASPRTAFDRDGNFDIRDVTPGTYLLSAEASEDKRLTGSAILTVAEENIDQLELMVTPAREWAGKIRVEGGGRLDPAKALVATLEPRSERGSTCSAGVRNLAFTCQVLADEKYDFGMQNLSDDFFVSAVRVNGSDMLATGLDASLASSDHPLEVVLDSRGGRVGGVVAGADGNAWSGANLMLVPDPAVGRLNSYRDGSADEYGRFQIRGVPPGQFLLIAWLDDPPCDFYDPDALDTCRGTALPVTVTQASQQNVLFTVKPSR
jgi:hypothetical protein